MNNHPEILVDILDNYVPKATMAATTAPPQRGVYVAPVIGWHIATIAEGLSGDDRPEFGDLDEVRAWLDANNWRIEREEKDGHNRPRWTIVHQPTEIARDAAKARHDAKWADASVCFVRYGDLPADGVSRNHADGVAEAGVSVFRGLVLPSGEAMATPETSMMYVSMVALRDRPLYIVEGDEVATGSDGEPVLAHARIVAEAK